MSVSSPIRTILIVGAGGVGGYVGAQLTRHTDASVTLLARGEHLQAIQKNGLTVHDNDETYTVHPQTATDDPSILGIFDFVLVAVKAVSLSESLKSISNNINDKTVILPILNGVDHDRNIRQYHPNSVVLDGHIYILSNLTAPGILRRKGQVLRLVWGSSDGIPPQTAQALTALFDAAHIHHKHAPDIQQASWRKYLFIASFAVLTSRYGVPMDVVYANHREELETLMHEIIAIAQAKGISLSNQDITAALLQASKVTPGAKTSLQLDIEAGKPAEIEALCGYVMREGKRLGVAVPKMEEMHGILSHPPLRTP